MCRIPSFRSFAILRSFIARPTTLFPHLIGSRAGRGTAKGTALKGSIIRVLVVDDYEPWRRFVCLTLQIYPGLQLVGELSDGLSAVQQAQELRPDLILLDIGLPTLHGIEAARLIREVSPQSKVLFVSANRSLEIAQKALQAGALGYVVKSDAARDLLPAVEAVVQGRRFISSSLGGIDLVISLQENTIDPDPADVFSNSAAQNAWHKSRHEVGFYLDDESFLDDLTAFVGAAIRAGSVAVVVATESHREQLLPRLQLHGFDLVAAIEQHRYLALDAAATLSAAMVNGRLDREKFLSVAGDLIVNAGKAAKREQPRVSICGECDPPLWAIAGDAAIQVEQLWNEIVSKYEVDVFCAYALGGVHRIDSDLFQRICAEHSAVHSR